MTIAIDGRFFTLKEELVKQRMHERDWSSILLHSKDQIIVRGRLRTLVAKKLGYGIVEVTLEPIPELEF